MNEVETPDAAYRRLLDVANDAIGELTRQRDEARNAADGLLLAVDNALNDALIESEDGAEEPAWVDRLGKAADLARDVIAPAGS